MAKETLVIFLQDYIFAVNILTLIDLFRYAASIDDILEEEEHYADQLKEYLFFAEALRCV